eukprot:scaffold332910_cov13-Prasinocladus_malaysianus.AAC.1
MSKASSKETLNLLAVILSLMSFAALTTCLFACDPLGFLSICDAVMIATMCCARVSTRPLLANAPSHMYGLLIAALPRACAASHRADWPVRGMLHCPAGPQPSGGVAGAPRSST